MLIKFKSRYVPTQNVVVYTTYNISITYYIIFFFLLLLLFPCRNGSGSSSGSREQSPTYQNWNHHSITNIKTKDNTITGGVSVVDASKKTNNSASDCTSSTECFYQTGVNNAK